MYRPYAGIGSRKTPEHILKEMYVLGYALAMNGFTLRSGGADGADKYFERGADAAEHVFVQKYRDELLKEIYLPWKWFNDNPSTLYEPTTQAFRMASEYHPAWDKLVEDGKEGAMKLHARNCHQVLGHNLIQPALFVVCWTEDGKLKGGTAQAIRIANDHEIPVFNLGIDGEYENLLDFVKPYVLGEK